MSHGGSIDHGLVRLLERADTEGWADHQRAAPREVVEHFGFAVRRIGGATLMLATRAVFSGLNRVIGLGLDAPLTEVLLDEVIAEYQRVGVTRVVLQLGPLATNAEIRELLSRRGIVAKTRHAKLWRRADATITMDTDLDVVEIGPSSRDVYGETAARSYGDPPVLAGGHSATVGRAGWRHFMAFDSGRPVSGAALFRYNDVAWCGFAATLADDRGRGAHGALLARRVRAAAEDGCSVVICETAEETAERPNASYRNMRRVGFEVAYYRPNYVWTASMP